MTANSTPSTPAVSGEDTAGSGVDLDAIRARAEAATPGPWEIYDPNEGMDPHSPLWSIANDAFHNPGDDDDEPWPAVNIVIETGGREDAEFLAHAREDIPALLAELAEAREVAQTCACYDGNPANYEGPHADCAVHGAIRAFNEAMCDLAKARDERDQARGQARAEADDAHRAAGAAYDVRMEYLAERNEARAEVDRLKAEVSEMADFAGTQSNARRAADRETADARAQLAEVTRERDQARRRALNNGQLLTVKSALANAEQNCRYHRQNWDFLGREADGRPRCDSCKQPYRVLRALEVVDSLLGADRG